MRLSTILDEVLELDSAQRDARVRQIQRESSPLAALVEQALASEGVAIALLDQPLSLALPEAVETTIAPTAQAQVDERVGPWRLTRELGRGGMGQVWLAERDDGQYRHQVAIKLIDAALDSDLLREQLRRERQILADLDHPHIARLLDGGIQPNGTPWYAMEYVKGRPLDDYCEQQHLPLAARLRLLASICRAVHHAHTHLVVHRDLKPGNILVDDSGVAHLLDFGIAKLLDPGGARGASRLTLLAAATPAYAAPEQLRGESVGTGADIYALGVIGFELACGVRPAAANGTLTNTDARGPLPSQAIAGQRQLRSALHGDIDAIFARALAPSPGDRYASAEALADDIQAHLQGLPVKARGAGKAYRARKFMRRHYFGVASVVVLVLALSAGLAGTLWQARQARAAAAHATAVTDFLTGLFKATDPSHNRGAQVSARELLDAGRRQIAAGAYASPALANQMRGVIGNLYVDLGLTDQAEPLLRQRLSDTLASHGPNDPLTTSARLDVASLDYYQSRYAEAVTLLQAVIAQLDANGGDNDPAYLRALLLQGEALRLQGKYAPARALYQHADAAALRIYGAHSYHRADVFSDIAALEQGLANFDAGLAAIRRGRAIADADPHTPTSLQLDLQRSEANLLRALNRNDEAAQVMSQTLRTAQTLYGKSNITVAGIETDLASVRRAQGHSEQALALLRDAIRFYERDPSGQKDALATAWFSLGRALSGLGKLDDAAAALSKAEALYRQALGPDHSYVAMVMMTSANVARRRGHLDEADKLARHAISVYEKVLPAGNPLIANAQLSWVRVLLAQGHAAAAEATARQVVANFRTHLGEHDARTDDARMALGEVLLAQAKRAQAREPLAQAVADYDARGAKHAEANKARKLLRSLDASKD